MHTSTHTCIYFKYHESPQATVIIKNCEDSDFGGKKPHILFTLKMLTGEL